MTTSKQHIKERMMHSAVRSWGLSETDTEASFDPLVGLLMGACATELEKIGTEIEATRSRVLERLVQLLSPEALTGVLPAHAIAYALPAEQVGKTTPEDQFYVSKRMQSGQEDATSIQDIYFSPIDDFILHKTIIKYKATSNKITSVDVGNKQAQLFFAQHKNTIPANQIWLGLHSKSLHVDGLRFYFEVLQPSQQKQFYGQLPKANWYVNKQIIIHQAGYPVKKENKHYLDIDAVLNRDISATEKIIDHINEFYQQHFITLQPTNTIAQIDGGKDLPAFVKLAYAEKDLQQLETNDLHWICIEFPESIHAGTLEEVFISCNSFPVVNRHLHDINFRIKEFINIIPLSSYESFLDIYKIVDQQGKQYQLRNENDEEDDLNILLRYGGVGRFDNREAAEMVDKLIHLLREETAAFSILGNDFLQNEMTLLQQTINKLEQQITNKQLLKGSTPYLIINNKQKETRQSLYLKYWTCNGASANLLKASTALNVYSSSQFETNTAKLITGTQGGRNKLDDTEKVLAYKSSLLSKQKLVTNEDIAAFCRLRLAFIQANIEIKKGFTVLSGETEGLARTLDVHINLNQNDWISLQQKGSIDFWQNDLQLAIAQHSNFFIPIKVFIKQAK